MRIRFAELVVAVAALGAMAYGYRYMVSQGLETVIASQPAVVKPADSFPSFDWSGCDVGLSTSRPSAASKPCRFEPAPYAVPQALPIQVMSEADSKKAGLWFSGAGLLPLAVGAVAVLVLFDYSDDLPDARRERGVASRVCGAGASCGGEARAGSL